MLAQSTFTTTHHIGSLVVFAAVVTALVILGRRHDLVTRRAFGAFAVGAWLLSSIYYVLPSNIEPDKSLPIQACDIIALLAPIALLLPSRYLRALMYFGGFGLTTQAFATPTSDIGAPDNIKFWIFWLLHGSIVGTAIYVVAVDRFRPTFRDYFNAVFFWFIYAVVMISLNYSTYAAGLNEGNGWYYGYLGPTLPEIVQGSVLKHFGQWPIRPLVIMLFGLVVYTLLYVPWLLVPERKRDGDQSESNASSPSSSS